MRPSEDNAGTDPETRIDLAQTIARLPEPQRQVVVLHYGADMPLKDVAAVLRIPLGTVQSRLSRARDSLARALTSEEKDHA